MKQLNRRLKTGFVFINVDACRENAADDTFSAGAGGSSVHMKALKAKRDTSAPIRSGVEKYARIRQTHSVSSNVHTVM